MSERKTVVPEGNKTYMTDEDRGAIADLKRRVEALERVVAGLQGHRVATPRSGAADEG